MYPAHDSDRNLKRELVGKNRHRVSRDLDRKRSALLEGKGWVSAVSRDLVLRIDLQTALLPVGVLHWGLKPGNCRSQHMRSRGPSCIMGQQSRIIIRICRGSGEAGSVLLNTSTREIVVANIPAGKEVMSVLAGMKTAYNHYILKTVNTLDRVLQARGTAAQAGVQMQ